VSNALTFSLGLTSGGFLQQIGAAQAGLGRLLGVTVGLGGVMAGVWKTIEHGAALHDLSLMTGETVENLFKLERGFELAGASASSVQGVLYRLNKALGGVNEMGEPTKDIFAAMGLSIENLKSKGGAAALSDVLAAMARLNRAQAASAAGKIFGRGGAQEMLLLANNAGDFARGMQAAAAGAARMQERAAAFDQLTDSIKLLKGQLTDLFIGPAGAFADMANSLVAAFQQGQLGTVVTLSFNAAFETSVAYLSNLLANPDFWGGFAETALAVFAKLGVALLQILSGPIRMISEKGLLTMGIPIPGADKIPEMISDLEARNSKLVAEFFASGSGKLGAAHRLASEITTPSQALLNDLLGSLAEAAGAGHRGGAGDLAGRGSRVKLGKLADANSLERIGAIFGGGAADWGRDTAKNTAKIATRVDRTNALLTMMAGRDFTLFNAD
jgi:hypothetical protein